MGLSKYYIRGYKKMLEKCAVFSAAPKNYVPNPNREGGDAAFASYYAIDPELAKKYSDSVINRDYHQAQMDDSFWTYPWHWIAHSSNANDADSARAEIARGAISAAGGNPELEKLMVRAKDLARAGTAYRQAANQRSWYNPAKWWSSEFADIYQTEFDDVHRQLQEMRNRQNPSTLMDRRTHDMWQAIHGGNAPTLSLNQQQVAAVQKNPATNVLANKDLIESTTGALHNPDTGMALNRANVGQNYKK